MSDLARQLFGDDTPAKRLALVVDLDDTVCTGFACPLRAALDVLLRLHRQRVEVLRRDADLLDEHIRSSVVRAPFRGMILTARPDERVGSHADAGDLVTVVGRTDSLELEFGVDERDITRVQIGDEVRLRIAAMPQHTFAGRVTSIGAISATAAGSVSFPVRAVVANPDGLLRPGMAAYARVLTEPASALWRLARGPVRATRLAWWRFWS
jgi:multidrug efflux pump subunit AcrA (membrane-fusion protein)